MAISFLSDHMKKAVPVTKKIQWIFHLLLIDMFQSLKLTPRCSPPAFGLHANRQKLSFNRSCSTRFVKYSLLRFQNSATKKGFGKHFEINENNKMSETVFYNVVSAYKIKSWLSTIFICGQQSFRKCIYFHESLDIDVLAKLFKKHLPIY